MGWRRRLAGQQETSSSRRTSQRRRRGRRYREAPGEAIRAQARLTLALPKTGLLEPCARSLVGELYVADAAECLRASRSRCAAIVRGWPARAANSLMDLHVMATCYHCGSEVPGDTPACPDCGAEQSERGDIRRLPQEVVSFTRAARTRASSFKSSATTRTICRCPAGRSRSADSSGRRRWVTTARYRRVAGEWRA